VFEKLGIKNFYLCKSGALSCFSSARSTALILDSGAQTTCAVPIHDGYPLQKNLIKFDVGGETLTEAMLHHIENEMKHQIVPRYALEFEKDTPSKTVSRIL